LRRNAGVAVAAVVAAAALVGMIVIFVTRLGGGASSARLPFATTTGAAPPFGEFDEARVAVGNRCLRVLVASDERQREQGLRGVRALAPYDGMLFVFPGDSGARFTMANTPLPLDITWFGADRRPVDHARMTPCPHGTDATCPQYASRARYRYALERPAGSGASGPIGPCAS
jgi:uncharacterized membrane protein (UPF0127 family)